MKPLPRVLWFSLATLAAGCITPVGYDRSLDGGATATGGTPAQGGTTGQAGSPGSPGTGGTPVATGGAPGSGGATGRGGGTGGAVVSTGGSGGTSSSGTGGAPPPPPGTVLYSDDFSGDTVGMMAKGWIADTIDSDPSDGTFSVVSDNGNLALQGAASGSDFIMDIGGDSSWTDYTFQVDIKMMSGSSFEFGVFGRFALGTDKGNYYEAYMDDSGSVQLRVKLNGSTTTLGTKSKSTTGDAQLNTVYTFKLDMHGSTINVSVNGVARVSMVMDTTLSTGGIGLIVNNGTAEFDNVYVTE
ncbi:MAG TPA: family 16 glycoside hydrolase [Polyangia bacterium]|nr:family 16 glycoside hydrolase [Polyangia bacterium]